jgi:hypothetical protein
MSTAAAAMRQIRTASPKAGHGQQAPHLLGSRGIDADDACGCLRGRHRRRIQLPAAHAQIRCVQRLATGLQTTKSSALQLHAEEVKTCHCRVATFAAAQVSHAQRLPARLRAGKGILRFSCMQSSQDCAA